MKNYPPYLDLSPAQNVQGDVHLPGSKSISNRILLLSALAQGTTQIHDLLISDDTTVMLNALRTLGVTWQNEPNTQIYEVQGQNSHFPIKKADLFLGNAGTAIRPLTAALSILGGDYTIRGVPRMHERPIKDLVDTLNQIGTHITYLNNTGYPPLHIGASQIHTHTLHVKGNVSSQFLTALLLSAPLIARTQSVQIRVVGALISQPYIEITLNLMKRFGVTVERDEWHTFTITPGQHYSSPGTIHVEGDASSASYFLAAGAIAKGPVRVHGIGRHSIQGDIRFVLALKQMGATVIEQDQWIEVHNSEGLKAINLDCNHIPDAAMTLAILALYANGTTTLRNIGSWRVKETDRLHAMATELRKLGAAIEEGPDYLTITPPTQLTPATIDTYDDHRMAMCFSLASLHGVLRNGVPIRINDPICVAKTFPDYFDIFAQITHP